VVTWRHCSCDHWTHNVAFPIRGVFEPTVYLARSRWDIKLQRYRATTHDLDLLGSSDVIINVTTGLLICGFRLVVNLNQPSISYGFWDIKLQRYWGHDLDLFRSRDVICHVAIGLLICGFLQVVLWNQCSISHRCWDIRCQTLNQAYSHWKCIDPHFCVLVVKIGGYSILQLCPCSRSLGTSFELLSATVGPQAPLLQFMDLPIENTLWPLWGWKIGAK